MQGSGKVAQKMNSLYLCTTILIIISTYDFIAFVYIANLPCIGKSCTVCRALATLDSFRFSRRKSSICTLPPPYMVLGV